MAGTFLKASETFELVAPLPLMECCSRLAALLDEPWSLQANHQVIGQMSGTKLRLRKRIQYLNSFQPWLFAEMIEQDGNTHIRGFFSMRPPIKAFMALWFGGLLLVGGILLVSPSGLGRTWQEFLNLTSMIFFGFVVIYLGRYLARGEPDFLLDVLRRTLAA